MSLPVNGSSENSSATSAAMPAAARWPAGASVDEKAKLRAEAEKKLITLKSYIRAGDLENANRWMIARSGMKYVEYECPEIYAKATQLFKNAQDEAKTAKTGKDAGDGKTN